MQSTHPYQDRRIFLPLIINPSTAAEAGQNAAAIILLVTDGDARRALATAQRSARAGRHPLSPAIRACLATLQRLAAPPRAEGGPAVC